MIHRTQARARYSLSFYWSLRKEEAAFILSKLEQRQVRHLSTKLLVGAHMQHHNDNSVDQAQVQPQAQAQAQTSTQHNAFSSSSSSSSSSTSSSSSSSSHSCRPSLKTKAQKSDEFVDKVLHRISQQISQSFRHETSQAMLKHCIDHQINANNNYNYNGNASPWQQMIRETVAKAAQAAEENQVIEAPLGQMNNTQIPVENIAAQTLSCSHNHSNVHRYSDSTTPPSIVDQDSSPSLTPDQLDYIRQKKLFEKHQNSVYQKFKLMDMPKVAPAKDLVQVQRDIENISIQAAIENLEKITQSCLTRGDMLNIPTISRLFFSWYGPVCNGFEILQKELKSGEVSFKDASHKPRRKPEPLSSDENDAPPWERNSHQHDHSNDTSSHVTAGQQQLSHNHNNFPRDITTYASQECARQFLLFLNPQELAVISMNAIVGEAFKDKGGNYLAFSVHKFIENAGRLVRAEVNRRKIANHNKEVKAAYRELQANIEQSDINHDKVHAKNISDLNPNEESVQSQSNSSPAPYKSKLIKTTKTFSIYAINRKALDADIDLDQDPSATNRFIGEKIAALLVDRCVLHQNIVENFLKSKAINHDFIETSSERSRFDKQQRFFLKIRNDHDKNNNAEFNPADSNHDNSQQLSASGSEPSDLDDSSRSIPAFKFIHECSRRVNGDDQNFIIKLKIQCNPTVIDILLSDMDHLKLFVRPLDSPMVIKPRPWTSIHKGVYLENSGVFIRGIDGLSAHKKDLMEADLTQVFQALNVLGSQPWKVNHRVLDVITKIWNNKAGLAGIVSLNDEEIPYISKDLQTSVAKYVVEKSNNNNNAPLDPKYMEELKLFFDLRRQKKKALQTNRERHSMRCDTFYRLQQAKEYAAFDRFYLPHNLDFRGRAYPMAPHLQHMGSDLCRGLLVFADGKPLGEKGGQWLKIHFANLCGMDKKSFEERIAYATEMMPRVFAVAQDPHKPENLEWWSNFEDPIQLVGTCFELAAAFKNGESRSRDYICSYPIHQDGSCNGLQHYAALGRDLEGGKQVNLVPSECPQDVYSGVQKRVVELIARDAAAGYELAKLVQDRITRKVVKQTVMTSVYGVTFIGAKDQIKNRLKEMHFLDEKQVHDCSIYLARLVLQSLGDIFRGATDTMDWLGKSARAVAHSGKFVKWVTPMGLPVIQPYRREQWQVVKTGSQRIRLYEKREESPIAKAKQKSAFPPNYIHSLDSTHMLKTALACHDQGLNFASVHDSFWTHAADVDVMNKILRDEFVKLHKRNLLEELREYFKIYAPEADIPPFPKRGTLDLDCVLESPYFFS